jgi:hypothetical protein
MANNEVRDGTLDLMVLETLQADNWAHTVAMDNRLLEGNS